jgi:hypothetical protein
MAVHTCNPSYSGNKRISVPSQLGKKLKPYLKNKLKTKGQGGGIVQVVEHLPKSMRH